MENKKGGFGPLFAMFFLAIFAGIWFVYDNMDHSTQQTMTQEQIDRKVVRECIKELDDTLKTQFEKNTLMVMCRKFRDNYVRNYGYQP